MARQQGNTTIAVTTPTIVPLTTVNRKPVVSTTITPPSLVGARVTRLRDLANGDIGYDARVDKFVVLHADGNEYIVRRDEIALG